MPAHGDFINDCSDLPHRRRTPEDVVEERLKLLTNEGKSVYADEEVDNLELPAYYDARKFELGQKVFANNVFAMMIAKLSGLLVLLALPTILDILIFTKQSGTPCAAFRRYVSTILHTFVWYENDPDKENKFFQSLKNVRRKHCVASKRCSQAGLPRITQWDMALTQFGFIGFTLLSNKQLGIVISREEEEGLVHFWRVVGYLLGTKDKFNLCSTSAEECKIMCRRLLEEVFIPSFKVENPNFKEMGRVLLEGLWPVTPFLDTKAYTTFTMQLSLSATANNNHSLDIDTSSLPLYSKFLLNLQWSVHKYLLSTEKWFSTYIRQLLNFLMRLAITITERRPFLAYYNWGVKNSQVNIYKYHYD